MKRSRRPKLRWFDCIENDLKSMSVKRWRNKAEDRYEGWNFNSGNYLFTTDTK